MSEQRLIDATELRRIFDVWLSEMNDNDPEDQQTGTAIHDCACQIDDAPTIDPETLPIVRELREKLERVTAERDAAIVRIRQSHWCEDCKNNQIMKLCANECDCDFCGEPCYCENCHEGNLWEWRGPGGGHS